MRNALSALGALAVLSLLGCGGETAKPKPLPAPPSIKIFAADNTRITAGASVTLSFEAENATEAQLVDQFGTKIPLTGSATAGTAQVAPAQTGFYVLRVSGEGGRASAFVQVAVDEDLAETFVVAVPSTIDSGQTAQLLWSAQRAETVTLTSSSGAEVAIDTSASSGVAEVSPARSESYTLTAGDKVATAQVMVRPVLAASSLEPAAAEVGQDLTFTWTTRGAREVTVTEKTFGDLYTVAVPLDAAEVDQGSFTWTVPDTLPDGGAVTPGFPLEFTIAVTQSNPDVTLTRAFSSFVGTGPRLVAVDMPSAVTEGKTFTISWSTLNAERLQIFADGQLMFEPLAWNAAQVSNGSIELQAPLSDASFKVVAYGHLGTTAVRTQLLKVVKAPEITSFDLQAMVAQPGTRAQATWTTRDATRVNLRVKDGVTVFSTVDGTAVAGGNADVFPGARTSYVLEAVNAAGDSATLEKTVDVAVPGLITAEPTPITTGEAVTVSWDIDPTNVSEVYGDLTQEPVKNNPPADFVDLSLHSNATVVRFRDSNDDVVKLAVPPGLRFPFAGRAMESFFVSTNGFVAFEPTAALPSNDSLDSPTAPIPTMVAPYWDDLVVGADSAVYYLVDGATFPRRLIVQWNNVSLAASPDVRLTFQVQLRETGELRFVYPQLGAGAAGESASVGWRVDKDLARELANNGNAVLVNGDEEIFFNSGATTGQYTAHLTTSGAFSLIARLGSGDYVSYAAPVTVFVPGAVRVNEAMVLPDVTALFGQWIELFNTTSQDIDLGRTTLGPASGPDFVFPDGTVIPAGGYLVIGQSKDPNLNGAINVDLEWPQMSLPSDADDSIVLRANNAIDQLAYTQAEIAKLGAGTTVMIPGAGWDGDAQPLPCTVRKVYMPNSTTAFGTPGAANESCFPYEFSNIPESFEDISATGLVLHGPAVNGLEAKISVQSAPITYFGVSYDFLVVETNGNIYFDIDAYKSYNNGTLPKSSDPQGIICPFWDDLATGPEANSQIYIQHLPATATLGGRWIVQFAHITHYNVGDDLNFEAKIFDDGAIEYHYATMASGSSSLYGDGRSATIWLNAVDGSMAWPIGVNEPVIKPHTAYRFTPKL